jgi:hypothetical protein
MTWVLGAASVYYCETYGLRLNIIKNKPCLFGTSKDFGKNKSHNNSAYNTTIFSKLTFVDTCDDNIVIVHNNYKDNKIIPSGNIWS